MKNVKLIGLLAILILVTGCGDKSINNIESHQVLAKEPNVVEQQDKTIDLNEIEFPLYKTTPDGYNYIYKNANIIVNDNMIIDSENKKIYSRLSNKELDYNEYVENYPTHLVINYVLVNNKCKQKIACDHMGCSISNYKLEELQEEIDPVNGISLDYLMYEYCPINIPDELVNELNNNGYKTWGRGLANLNNQNTPLSIAIELPDNNTYLTEKALFEKYGLISLLGTSPKQYFSKPLSKSTCKEYNLNCKEVN